MLHVKMEYKRSVLFTILAFIVVLVNCDEYSSSNGAYNRRGSLPMLCPYCNTLPPPKRGTPGTQSCCDNSSKGVESVKLVGQGGRGVYVGPITNPAIPRRCCRGAVRNYFKMDQFENIFSKRNSLEVEDHANKGFWDYQSFITASALYQPYGCGTTYMNWTFFGTKEVAAFLAHVATKISCEYCRLSVL